MRALRREERRERERERGVEGGVEGCRERERGRETGRERDGESKILRERGECREQRTGRVGQKKSNEGIKREG